MRVSEVMHKGVSTVQINDSIRKVASLMKREDIGAVPVFKNERAVGFVTDRDIVISCVAHGHGGDEPISLAMKKGIISCKESDDIAHAAKLMREHQISRIMVVDEGQCPVGMVGLHDIGLNSHDDLLVASVVEEVKR
jgi:predicted transcriptional regulator